MLPPNRARPPARAPARSGGPYTDAPTPGVVRWPVTEEWSPAGYRGFTTVGQVAQLSEEALVDMLGRAAGRKLHALSHNRDPRPVQPRKRRRSIGAQRALGRRATPPDALDAILLGLVDRLARRLRAACRVCRTVVLRLRFADFSRATRSHTLAEATAQTGAILAVARELVAEAGPLIERRGLSLVGLTLTNLGDHGAVQLALPLERRDRAVLDVTVDGLRDEFGSDAIKRGTLVGRDGGISVPLLPDEGDD